MQNSNLQGVTNASDLKLVVHSDYPKRQNMFLNQMWQQLTVKLGALTHVTFKIENQSFLKRSQYTDIKFSILKLSVKPKIRL